VVVASEIYVARDNGEMGQACISMACESCIVLNGMSEQWWSGLTLVHLFARRIV
jgi:hypothetical protein